MKIYETFTELQDSTQALEGLALFCRENLYLYIVQDADYVATGDDVTFVNGRVGKASFVADAKYIKTTGGNVQDDLDSIIAGSLPSQANNQFKFLSTNGTGANWAVAAYEVGTFAQLQALGPVSDGQSFICQERANARYILRELAYVAQPGDVTFANGRVGELQDITTAKTGGLSENLNRSDVVILDSDEERLSQLPVSSNKSFLGDNQKTISVADNSGFGVGDAVLRGNGADNLFVSGIDFDITGGSKSLRGITVQGADNSIIKGVTGSFTGRGTYPVFFVNTCYYHHVSDINITSEDYGFLWKPQFANAFVTDPSDPNYHEGGNFLLTNSMFKGADTNDGGKIGVSLDGEMVGGLVSGVHVADFEDLNLIGEGFGLALANESDQPERFRGIVVSGFLASNCRNEGLHFEDEARGFAGAGVGVIDSGHGIRFSAAAAPSTTPPTPAIDVEGRFTGTVHTGYVIDTVREEAITIEGASHAGIGGEAHVFSDMVISNWNADNAGWAAVWFPAEYTNSIILSNLIFKDATGDIFRINADHGGESGFNNGPIVIENIIAHNVDGYAFDIVTNESNSHIFIKSGSNFSGCNDVFSPSSSLNNVITEDEFFSEKVEAGVSSGETYMCKTMDFDGYIVGGRFVFTSNNDATVNDFWKLRKRTAAGVTSDVATIGIGTSGEVAFQSKDLESSLPTVANRKFSKGDVFWIEKSGSAGDGTYKGRFEFMYFTHF